MTLKCLFLPANELPLLLIIWVITLIVASIKALVWCLLCRLFALLAVHRPVVRLGALALLAVHTLADHSPGLADHTVVAPAGQIHLHHIVVPVQAGHIHLDQRAVHLELPHSFSSYQKQSPEPERLQALLQIQELE